MTKLPYRADIDGLRAVSVLVVMLFHAGFGMPGGYVGVDVFFVISGYLITKLIAKDLDENAFSLLSFWERRIRRIWPAGMCMTLGVLLAAYFVMLPRDFSISAKDAIAQLLMAANVHYAQSLNYFTGPGDLRPLLHTWSLAVEEQFYFLLPPFLMVIWKVNRRFAFTAVGLVALASIAVSVWLVEHHPRPAYYLLPSRGWELAMGSMVALGGERFQASQKVKALFSWLGIALVLFPVFFHDDFTRFPGLAALAPCLGAVILILCEGAPVNRALSVAPLRAMGLMSYSLYLWHWPVLAFLRYAWGQELSVPLALAAIGVTFVLSWMSWRFVETQFRGSGQSQQRTFVVGFGMLGLGIALAWSVISRECLPSRFPERIVEYVNHQHPPTDIRMIPALGLGRFDDDFTFDPGLYLTPLGTQQDGVRPPRVDFLLWGDSHAVDLAGVFDYAARARGLVGLASIRYASLPVPGVEHVGPHLHKGSNFYNEGVLQWIVQQRPPHVFLVARWSAGVSGNPNGGSLNTLVGTPGRKRSDPELAQALVRQGLDRIVQVTRDIGVHVWFLLEIPSQALLPHHYALQAYRNNTPLPTHGCSRLEHEAIVGTVRSIFAGIDACHVDTVDLSDALFGGGNFASISNGSWSYYQDHDHIREWARYEVFGSTIEGLLDRVASQSAQPKSE